MEHDVQIDLSGEYTGFRVKTRRGELFFRHILESPTVDFYNMIGRDDGFLWTHNADGREVINQGSTLGVRFALVEETTC